jgi:hypothetical protein
MTAALKAAAGASIQITETTIIHLARPRMRLLRWAGMPRAT